MLEAGLRKRTLTVPLDVPRLAATLQRHLSPAQIGALIQALIETSEMLSHTEAKRRLGVKKKPKQPIP